MSQDKGKDTKEFFKEWLEKLQQESWQLELLISGLALLGIYEARPLLHEFKHFIDLHVDGVAHGVLVGINLVLKVGWKIFFINLLIHVILRGLWIGTIGLRYVSDEIDYDALNYSDRFRSYLERRVGAYDDFIERLEYICSILFAYTFLLFLLFLSFILFFIWIPVFASIEEAVRGSDAGQLFIGVFILLYLILGLIVFIDFITVGAFKKIRDGVVSRIYMWIYRFYSTITLSFFYRPLLYNFIDDRGTRRLFFCSVPYILVLAFGQKLVSSQPRPYFQKIDEAKYGEAINVCHYDDLRLQAMRRTEGEDRIGFKNCYETVVLDKFYMDSDYPSIFFKMLQSDRNLLKERDLEPIYKDGIRWDISPSGGKYKSQKEASIREEYGVLIDSIREQISDVRKEIRALGGDEKSELESLNDRLDVLKSNRDSLSALLTSDIARQKRENVSDIIDYYRRTNSLTIDDDNYSDSLTCHYYEVPENGIQGILCHFPSSAIKRGPHMLKVEREIYDRRSDDKSRIERYSLPFIKIK